MIDKDGNHKPNGAMFDRLIRSEWWTDETVFTDAGGAAMIRGFLGDYRIGLEGDENPSQSCTLRPGINTMHLIASP